MMLLQYIRRGGGKNTPNDIKRQLIGAVVAFQDGDTVRVGWSLCHKGDKFKRTEAKRLAAICANNPDAKRPIPRVVVTTMAALVDRSARYFKGAKAFEY